MHLTLNKETTKPAANNFLQQQEKFDRFIDCVNGPPNKPTKWSGSPASQSRSRAYNESSGLPPPGNDDGFAERTLIFLLANRIHGPQLRQQVVDQQSQARPRSAARERTLVLDRPRDDRDQEGHLGGRQRLGFATEILVGRGPQSTQVRSPFDDVQVDLENTILAERRLQQERNRQFLQ